MKIPIKKYVIDESISWEERYNRLEIHHKEETDFFMKYAKQLEEKVKFLESELELKKLFSLKHENIDFTSSL